MFTLRKNAAGKYVLVGKVTVDGVEQEVEHELPEGLYHSDTVRELFVPKAEFQRRADSIAATKLDAALEDNDFRARALAKWGIKEGEDGGDKSQLTAEQVTSLQKQWANEHVNPLKAQLETVQQRADRLLKRSLHADILQAANDLGFKELFVKGVNGQSPMILGMTEGYFAPDTKTDSWFVKDGDGFAISANPTETRTYKDAREFLADFAKANPEVLDDKRQKGPKAGDPNPGTAGSIQDQIKAAEAAGNFQQASALKAQALQAAR